MDNLAVFLVLLFIISAIIAGFTIIALLIKVAINNYAVLLKINLYFWIFLIAFFIVLAIINK